MRLRQRQPGGSRARGAEGETQRRGWTRRHRSRRTAGAGWNRHPAPSWAQPGEERRSMPGASLCEECAGRCARSGWCRARRRWPHRERDGRDTPGEADDDGLNEKRERRMGEGKVAIRHLAERNAGCGVEHVAQVPQDCNVRVLTENHPSRCGKEHGGREKVSATPAGSAQGSIRTARRGPEGLIPTILRSRMNRYGNPRPFARQDQPGTVYRSAAGGWFPRAFDRLSDIGDA